MGSGASSEAENHQKIERDLKRQRAVNRKTQKLLLLGPGGSGKSTILKQMKILHADGFSESYKEQHRLLVRFNLIQSAASILTAMESMNIPLHNPRLQGAVELVLTGMKDFQKNSENSLGLHEELVIALKQLWADQGVQKAFERKDEYQLIDSAKFYLDNIDRIADPTYRPDDDDILRCRVKTTGVVEVGFTMKATLFRVVDVGGQRSERRKWIQCFSDVNSIVFVASLSEYNQLLEEDNATNRMVESLNLFGWITNHHLFGVTPIILFLNKRDIFEEKIAQFPLKNTFPEYTGDFASSEAGMEYIKTMYENQNKNVKRAVYTHFTCATDTNQVRAILDSTIDAVLSRNLNEMAL